MLIVLNNTPEIQKYFRGYEMNGPQGQLTPLDGMPLQHKTIDSHQEDITYPLCVPTKEQDLNYSFAKTAFITIENDKNWEGFCGALGCTCIRKILLFMDKSVFGRCSLVSDHWSLSRRRGRGGLVIGHRDYGDHGMPLDQYQQAEGIMGETGSPIGRYHKYYSLQKKPVVHMDCYDYEHPYLLDTECKIGPFRSKAWVTQIVVPHEAMPGQKPELDIHIGLVID